MSAAKMSAAKMPTAEVASMTTARLSLAGKHQRTHRQHRCARDDGNYTHYAKHEIGSISLARE
jgi:hypothetical protein